MIQSFLDEGKVFPGDIGEVRSFWKGLANEAIGVLIRAAVLGRIRMCEVSLSLQFTGNLRMIGEVLAVVKGDGQRFELIRL